MSPTSRLSVQIYILQVTKNISVNMGSIFLHIKNQFKKKPLYLIWLLIVVALFLSFLFILPSKLFKDPYCTVITDKDNQLLGANISEDGQFRFPETEKVSKKFEQCILNFEDKRFYVHGGVDLMAVFRAVKQNISQDGIVSGASTISMQTIRLARKDKPRTLYEKLVEMLWTARLEMRLSKDEILAKYASHAPFGGNVVGIDAAAWRWFGTSAEKLTWAQTATLAVLPNAPSLIHPGRNSDLLKNKRNRLLKTLHKRGIIDSETYALAVSEMIPQKPAAFPFEAYHVLMKANVKKNDAVIQTTIDADIQKKVNEIVRRNHKHLRHLDVMNMAVLVLETETGKVRAYIGNIPFAGNSNVTSEQFIDMIPAVRSTGSVLKPFLFAGMLTSGDILENALILDIPTRMGNFIPKNYNMSYDGAIPAGQALARSLNIPAARMLRRYGLQRFYKKLEQTGMTSLNHPASYYGLSIVLGGCEASLWELTGMYASTARSLLHYIPYGNQYDPNDYHPPVLFSKKAKPKEGEAWKRYSAFAPYDASALWTTFKAMLDVDRPTTELNKDSYFSSENIAWKTGTSFGFRDAWSIGLTPKYTVGVWVGNADGEGKAGLIGVHAAAPILFEVFDLLPDAESWFELPVNDLMEIEVCKQSGFLAGINCPETERIFAGKQAERFSVCPYHKILHLDNTGEHRVHAHCESVLNMTNESRFILPPAAEKYYKRKHAGYKGLPPYRKDCQSSEYTEDSEDIEIVYPFNYSQIYIPIELDGSAGKAVFEAVHRNENAQLFWYIDDNFIADTKYYHLIETRPDKGKHTLTIVDNKGEKITRRFEVISKNEPENKN